MSGTIRWVTVVAAVGSGLVAGVFFAFSTFVMKGLDRLPPAQAVRSMQAINVAAPSPLFMLALFGTVVPCAWVAVDAIGRLDDTAAVWALVGAVLYLVPILLTIAFHVPRNDALASVDPDAAGAAAAWATYVREWTLGNHLRTIGAVASATCLAVALAVE